MCRLKKNAHNAFKLDLISSLCLFLILSINHLVYAVEEVERVFRVSEALPPGHQIGIIYGAAADSSEPPPPDRQNYYIVFLDDDQNAERAEKILRVDDRTGEVWLRQGQHLDFEREQKIQFLAILVDGSPTIRVIIEIQDENDNAPAFLTEIVRLNVSEYAKINTELALPLARDPDSGDFGVQKYRIAAGNLNNAFRLSYDPSLYLDLIVNGRLDREYRARYELRVEAFDGGRPPKTASLNVIVDVLDVNDNVPEFTQSKYTVWISPDTIAGAPLLKLAAKDADEEENGRISYHLTPSQNEDHSSMFHLDPNTGVLSLTSNETSFPDLPDSFELTAVARDSGIQPLESSTRISVFVDKKLQHQNSSSQRSRGQARSSRLSLIWLTDDGLPRVSENTPKGTLLARIQLLQQSTGTVKENVTSLALLGGSGALCLNATESSDGVYFLVVCGSLDRETFSGAGIQLSFVPKGAEDEVLLDHPVHLELLDENDNAPRWNQTEWVLDIEDIVSGSVRLLAVDDDAGENGRIQYTLEGTGEFGIDPDTGTIHLLTLAQNNERRIWEEADSDNNEIECSERTFSSLLTTTSPFTKSNSDNTARTARFRVRAEDHGTPKPFSSTAEVLVNFSPTRKSSFLSSLGIRFRHSQYTVSVPENAGIGTCFLQTEAFVRRNDGCPISPGSASKIGALITYSFKEDVSDPATITPFRIDSGTGRICLTRQLDLSNPFYQFIVTAKVASPEDDLPLTSISSADVQREKSFRPSEIVTETLVTVLLEPATDGFHPLCFVPANYTAVLSVHDSERQKLARGGPLFRTLTVSSSSLASSLVEYAIDEDAPKRWFRIEPASGTLFVNEENELAAEEVLREGFLEEFNVRAKGINDFQTVGDATAKVLIRTVKQPCVTFSESIFEFTVPEDVLPGIAIGELRLLGGAQPEDFHFEIVSTKPKEKGCDQINTPFSGSFVFDEKNPNKLLVIGELDADKYQAKNGTVTTLLNIRVTNKQNRCSNFTQALIHVEDINDNEPVFMVEQATTELPEDFPINQPFFTIRAMDKDRNENGRIGYTLLKSDPPCPVAIDYHTGELSLTAPLDAESDNHYLIQIRANDHGVPPHHSHRPFKLHLKVLDVNDHRPVFRQPFYNVEVPENVAPSTLLLRVSATDSDASSPNNLIRYRLLIPQSSGPTTENGDFVDNPNSIVSLNSRTGELFVGPLGFDREKRTSYSFLVEARDRGKPSTGATNTTIYLRMLDVNDNGPNCSSLQQPVLVNLNSLGSPVSPGDRLAKIMFDDPDEAENGTVRVRLQSPNEYFELSSKGDLILREIPNLDLFARNENQFNNSESNFLQSKIFHLAVIAEDQSQWAPRSVVCDVQLNITMPLSSGTDNNRHISASSIMSTVSTLTSVTSESDCVYEVVVRARRLLNMIIAGFQKNMALPKPIFIVPPIDLTELQAKANKDSSKVELFDKNFSSSNKTSTASEVFSTLFYYKMVGGHRDLLELDELSGAVYISDPAKILLELVDRIKNENISASGHNEGNTNNRPLPRIFYDNVKIRRYWLRDPPPDLWPLTLNLAEERLRTLSLRLIVESDASLFFPKFSSAILRFSVNETLSVGSTVGQVQLMWPPPRLYSSNNNDGIQFRMVTDMEDEAGGFPASLQFRIDPQQGLIQLQKSLNAALAKRHVLVVEAYSPDYGSNNGGDKESLTSSSSSSSSLRTRQAEDTSKTARCVVIIDVQRDPQRHPPQFRSPPNATIFLANFPLPERKSLPTNQSSLITTFHHFVARSEGSWSSEETPMYQIPSFVAGADIEQQQQKTALEMFNLDPFTGALSFSIWNLSLLHTNPTISILKFKVRASTGQTHTDQLFTVLVDRSGLQFRYFPSRHTTLVVNEKTLNPGTSIEEFKKANGESKEVEEGVQFMLFSNEELELPFEIGLDDGILRVKGTELNSLEMEKLKSPNKYRMTILAQENGKFDYMELTVIFKVIDDGGPKIAQSSCGNVTLLENVELRNFLRVLLLKNITKNEDNIELRNVTFRIEGGSGADKFSIDPRTASDLQATPVKADVCTVRVIVADENDNAPEFLSGTSPEEIRIDQLTNLSQVLTRVEARDPDEGENGQVRYVLAEDRSRMLDLDPISGELRFVRELPFTGTEWTVSVLAVDLGISRQLHTEHRIRIRILWRREVIPTMGSQQPLEFLQRHYFAVLPENEPRGRFVAQLETTSSSALSNNQSSFSYSKHRQQHQQEAVLYSIVGGNQDEVFEVDSNGKVFTAAELDHEIAALYRLRVALASPASSTKMAETELEIRVLDRNDNTPSLPPLFSVDEVPENAPVGTLITTIQATDVDPNSHLEYSIDYPPKQTQFELGHFTGALHLVKPLDFEKQKSHLLRIQVSDGIHFAYTNLSIPVKDVNDNSPKFEQSFLELDSVPKMSGINPIPVARLEARDEDSGENGLIKYTLLGPEKAKSWVLVNRRTGELSFLPHKMPSGPPGPIFIQVKAEDGGSPPLHSLATVLFRLGTPSSSELSASRPRFRRSNHSFVVAEDMPLPLSLGRLEVLFEGRERPKNRPISESHENYRQLNCDFAILSNSEEIKKNAGTKLSLSRSWSESRERSLKEEPSQRAKVEEIFSVDQSGVLYLRQPLTSNLNTNISLLTPKEFRFQVQVSRCPPALQQQHRTTTSKFAHSFSITDVLVLVQDINDHPPVFDADKEPLELSRISDKSHRGEYLGRVTARDADPTPENARIRYRILAGNELGMLRIAKDSGHLTLDHWDDLFPLQQLIWGENETKLVISASDSGLPEQRAEILANFGLDLMQWAGSVPHFILPTYRKVIVKSTPSAKVGKALFNVNAVNFWRPESRSNWSCSLVPTGEDLPFSIVDANTCALSLTTNVTNSVSDSSSLTMTKRFNLSVVDERNRSASVRVEVSVVSLDEHSPQFTRPSYTFRLKYPPRTGAAFGRVQARDKDSSGDVSEKDGFGSAILYRITSDSASSSAGGAAFIDLNPRTGVLRVAKSENGEQKFPRRGDSWVERVVVEALPPAANSPEELRRRTASAIIYIEIGDGFEESSEYELSDEKDISENNSNNNITDSDHRLGIVPLIQDIKYIGMVFVLVLFLLLILSIAALMIRKRCFMGQLSKKSANGRAGNGTAGARENAEPPFLVKCSERKVPFSVSACQKREQQLRRSGTTQLHLCTPGSGKGGTSGTGSMAGIVELKVPGINGLRPSTSNYVNVAEIDTMADVPPPPPDSAGGSRQSQPDSGVHLLGADEEDSNSTTSSSAAGETTHGETPLADAYLARLGVPPNGGKGKTFVSNKNNGFCNGNNYNRRELVRRANELRKNAENKRPPQSEEEEILHELLYAPLDEILPTFVAPPMGGEDHQANLQLDEEEFPLPPPPFSGGLGLLNFQYQKNGGEEKQIGVPSFPIAELVREELSKKQEIPQLSKECHV